MRRNAWMAAVAVAVVGLLVAPLAFGSNMGFKLERDLDKVPGGLSYYVMSLPFYRSFQHLWNTTDADFGGVDDGVMSDDVLADWFSGGDGDCSNYPNECNGSISLLKFFNEDPNPDKVNTWAGQTIAWNTFLNKAQISGDPFPVDDVDEPGRGYLVQIVTGEFPIVIVGSHNPDASMSGFTMTWVDGALNKHPFSLPYHNFYDHTDPSLVGTSQALLDAIPRPDMDNGIQILRFINDPNDPISGDQFNQWVGQTVIWNTFLNEKQFSGDPFPLIPGDGYVLIPQAAPPNGPPATATIPLPHY